VEPESSWSVALADYIRNNDQSLQEASKKVLAMFQDELLPCETFAEFCDVAGMSSRHIFFSVSDGLSLSCQCCLMLWNERQLRLSACTTTTATVLMSLPLGTGLS